MGTSESAPDTAAGGKVGQESFDARLARLETIVGELEEGNLELESAIERYRQGVRLLKDCQTTLAGFRKQVEELNSNASEGLEAFAGDPDAPPGS